MENFQFFWEISIRLNRNRRFWAEAEITIFFFGQSIKEIFFLEKAEKLCCWCFWKNEFWNFGRGLGFSSMVTTRHWNWKITSFCFALKTCFRVDKNRPKIFFDIWNVGRKYFLTFEKLHLDLQGFFEKHSCWCFFGQAEKFENLKICVEVGEFEIGYDAALKLENYFFLFRFENGFPSR